MEPKSLCPELCVSQQITLADVVQAKEQGFRAIINNRPDGEEPGQPSSADVAAAAEKAGLAYIHIPVIPGQIGQADVAAFQRALETLPHPILGYCRTGARASTLWALCQRGKQPAEAILDSAAQAGYDLSALKPRLG